MSLRILGPLALFLTIHPPLVLAQSASPTDQDLIRQARRAYYSATAHGFNGFQAKIDPNWKVILGPTATPSNLKFFQSLRFAVTVDAAGSATVAYEVGRTQRVEAYVKRIHDDVERLVSRFFSTWALFMVSSPFPESQLKIEPLSNAYRILYTLQSAEVVLTLTDDLQIKELMIIDPSSRRTINPLFQKTSEGLLLRDYHTVFEPIGPGSKSTIDTTVEYRDLGGMKLPNRIHVTGIYANEPVEAELSFSEHKPNKPPQ